MAAEWEFSCLFLPSNSRDHDLHGHGGGAQGQFLAFSIKEIDGQSLPGGTVGFSVSYNQSTHPQLFRVESEAYPVPNADSTREWLALPPPDGPSETSTSDQNQFPESSSIDDEMRELHRLEAEAKQLRMAIKEQKRVVWRLFKAELKGLKGQIKQCEDMSCALDVALRKAGWAMRTIYGGFRPIKEPHTTSRHGEEKTRWRWFRNLSWKKHDSSKDSGLSSCSSLNSNVDRAQAGLSLSGPSCSSVDRHDSMAQIGTKPVNHKDRHARKPSYQQGPRLLALAFIIGNILAFAIFPIGLIILVIRRCSHSRRTVESHRAARLVRHAHRRNAFRKWWTNLWRDPRITDYEEKRALILEQERILELAMQDEIRELQSAAEAVSSLVSGDDGRGSAPSMRGPYGPRPTLSRQDSLPDYRSEASYGEPPPSYDDSNDDGLGEAVVDGFQYGSRIGSHYVAEPSEWTPDSSIVGTSVRGDISSDEEAP